VRLEADATGGELHVRATVIGDDGRAQSFRRLVMHVAGPDGFVRETTLEATGAGAYSASIPLSRPGTYLTVVRDELSGDAVGTTGAVLTAGEELRPTGSDRTLLGRIAELTGGKKRDTLAGIFADRASQRFAYEDAARPLLLLATFGLLLAVTARRLTLPDAMVTLPGRLWTLARALRTARPATPPQAEATLEALLGARDRAARARETPTAAGQASTAKRAAPVTGALAYSPTMPVAAIAKPSRGAGVTPPSSTPLTAAEILLARRKRERP
jgi:hypothetical protein